MSERLPRVFDANVRIGRLAASRGRHFEKSADVIAAMDEFGISRSLVYSALARESDCIRGNRLLQEQIAGQSRLIPCWIGIPHREPAAQLVDRMNQFQVPALRLFPSSGHFSARPWCLASLADALSANAKTLILDFEGSTWSKDDIDWEGIQQLCATWPRLPVVVCSVTMAGPANYRGLLLQCQNLYLEISELVSPGEISQLANAGLSDRLLFGSNMPTRHIGAPLAMIGMSTLDAASRRRILHENSERLLLPYGSLENPVTLREVPRFADVVDTHVHLGGWNNSAAASGRTEDTIREMDRCGIQCAVATSLWSCFGEMALGNEDVAKACASFPGRIYGYLTLDPKHPAEVQSQLRRHEDNDSFRGIKLHTETHAVPITDTLYSEILAYAHMRKMPVLIHAGFDPSTWENLCCLYPDAQFIAAHVGGAGQNNSQAIALASLARTVKNLHFDLASTRNFYGFLNELIALAGIDKILYGSDYPLMDFAFELGQIIFGNITEFEKYSILSKNARRIFSIENRFIDIPPDIS